MKLFFTLLLVCSFTFPAYAQWKKVSSPTFEDLYDIQIVDKTGYIAGQASTVLKTTDTGKTWKKISVTIPGNLRALYFIDSSTGFVTGENARIQKTIDGGKTWSTKYIRTAAYAYNIKFRNNFGLAVGRDMLAVRTSDFGETWQVDTTFHSNKKLNSICMLPGGMCWAVGDSGYMLKKHVSDYKWTVIKYPGKIDLNHISSIGDSLLFVIGGMPDSSQVGVHFNIFLRSDDSGKTWTSTKVPEMKTIYTGWFFSRDTGLMAGSNGIISKYYDPFATRSKQLSGTPSSLNRMFFYGENGFIVGDGGTILKTDNRGGFGLAVNDAQDLQIEVFPNPSTGYFYIQTPVDVVRILVFDQQGKLVKNCIPGDPYFRIEQKGLFQVLVELENGNSIVRTVLVN